ncbi:MAG: hypothetical protein ACJAQ4_002696 [Cryomorphaceae bacterium]|jgi:hypothetical protein
MGNFNVGDNLKWSWGNGHGMGKVKGKFTSDVSILIKANLVRQNTFEKEPANLLATGGWR